MSILARRPRAKWLEVELFGSVDDVGLWELQFSVGTREPSGPGDRSPRLPLTTAVPLSPIEKWSQGCRVEGLSMRRRKRKRVAVARQPLPVPTRLNEGWALDFMSDALSNGRRFRVLNVVDMLSREALASEVDSSLPAARVVQTLETIALERGYPLRISLDNGPELRSRALDQWACEHGVVLDFIQPGKPIHDAMIESFNGKMREELLNTRWWRTLAEARAAVTAHVEGHNQVRPHDSLARRTPRENARTLQRYLSPQRLAF